MRCSIEGCSGSYQTKLIVHPVRFRGEVIVIDHVPAEVCPVCGDVLLKPDTIRKIESILKKSGKPDATAPLFEFA